MRPSEETDGQKSSRSQICAQEAPIGSDSVSADSNLIDELFKLDQIDLKKLISQSPAACCPIKRQGEPTVQDSPLEHRPLIEDLKQ
jgi:hypothetical protein